MIRIAHLSKFFGEKILFSDVNLTIGEKEKIGLIGRNGSGKSTFLKMLLDQESWDNGTIDIPKRINVRALEQSLQFAKSTILEQVCSGLPVDAEHEEWKAKSILMGLGFRTEDFSRPPADFSSGMQVRVRLAEALVSEAQLLLLDEPTNYLDILSLRWLERFLQEWKGSFLLVTHDQRFMERVVQHTVGIHRGKMRKMKGDPQKLLTQIAKDEEVHEKTRQNMEKKDAKTKEFISKFRAGARSAGLVQSRIKALAKQEVKEKLEKLPDIKFHFRSEEFRGNTLLESTNISFGYEKDATIIQKFSLKVCAKERIAIVGRNGKGKSTLLKLLAGELENDEGKTKWHADLKIGYFAASSTDDLRPKNTILEELMMLPDVTEKQVRSVCGSLLFTGNDVKKEISCLSGGEKSRACFAKVLMSSVHILMLDEPTNHLDMESCQALASALDEFDGTVVIVTHDERMLSKLAKRLVVFDAESITVKEMGYEEFLESGGWSDEQEDLFVTEKKKEDSSQKQQYMELKEQRKLLRQVQNGQKKLAKELEKAEEKQIENAQLLQEAYQNSNRDRMEVLGREAKELAEQICDGYEKLEDMMEQEKELAKALNPPKE